jgi:hypothetical protein
VPKSAVRKKKVYTPPSDLVPVSGGVRTRPSAPWVGGLAVGLILFGLIWLIVFYLSGGSYPVASWGYWNLAVGFAGLVSSLVVLSRWR